MASRTPESSADEHDEGAGTLLVALPESRQRRRLLQALRGAGFAVAEAAPAALLSSLNGHVDALIWDGSGESAAILEALRESSDRPPLPCVLLESAEAAGAVPQSAALVPLPAPVDLPTLVGVVRGLCASRRREERLHRRLGAARELSLLKDDLFALVVHDVRNPLAGVFGFLYALEEAARSPAHAELREDVEGALASARAAREVLGDLLEIRLLEEGALRLRTVATSLPDLARAAIRSLSGAARERSMAVNLDAPAQSLCQADTKLLRRAVENLLANALKYSLPSSTVEVAVREGPATVSLSVSDSGPGVPDRFKRAVFEKFGSVEAERGEARRGFGLGLYQVQLVAAAHHGSVEVRDRKGGGSVFILTLPAAPPGAASS